MALFKNKTQFMEIQTSIKTFQQWAKQHPHISLIHVLQQEVLAISNEIQAHF
jgi:hypothetical protein